MEAVREFIFLNSKITAATKLNVLVLWKESYDKPRQCIKKQRQNFANKGSYSESHSFSGSHVQM